MQKHLFEIAKFPSTRYQGSKLKFVDWIWDRIKDIPFTSALDAFGGTGTLAYRLKQENKKVFYNDILTFNTIIAKAILENDSTTLDDYEVGEILKITQSKKAKGVISKHFTDIYYSDEENAWLDNVVGNIQKIDNIYKQAIAFFALFQSCIIKRPYNLFHRKNLYLRFQDVTRTFGNKKTWDTPFEIHFRNFVNEANAAVFTGAYPCRVHCSDIFHVRNKPYDLVYIDPPYISEKGIGVDYHHFYHFLEGISDYDHWEEKIDHTSKHKRLFKTDSDWIKPDRIESAFQRLFSKFQKSVLVVSYRSDGIPPVEKLTQMLQCFGKTTEVHTFCDIKYVLSTKKTEETLIIAK